MLRYSEASASIDSTARSLGVPRDDKRWALVGLTLALLAMCGCAQHAPPFVEAAIKARLQQYHDAWEAGDANGVRELPRAPKLALARDLVAEIAARLPPGSPR